MNSFHDKLFIKVIHYDYLIKDKRDENRSQFIYRF
jgi:hypothetical protein